MPSITSTSPPIRTPGFECSDEVLHSRQAETDRDGQDEPLRLAVEQQRVVYPLAHRVDSSPVKERYGPKHFDVLNTAVSIHSRLENHDALHFCSDRKRR